MHTEHIKKYNLNTNSSSIEFCDSSKSLRVSRKINCRPQLSFIGVDVRPDDWMFQYTRTRLLGV